MNLSQLKSVVAVADRGNFSEAALSLNLTQSSVSHAIAALEEELGVSLFVRGRHGAVPTSAGERIVEHARQVLLLLGQIEKEANLHRSLQGGRVRIAAFRSVATHLLPVVIARFRQCFPEVTVSITECASYVDVEESLRRGKADIGFTYLPTTDEFEAWEVLRDEYVLLVPPNIEWSRDRSTWEDLNAHPLILPPDDQPCEQLFYKHLATVAPPLNIAHTINQDSTIVSMVAQGLGIGILPRLAAEPIPAHVRVRSLPVPYERVIGVAVMSTTLHIPAVFAFMDALKEGIHKQVAA